MLRDETVEHNTRGLSRLPETQIAAAVERFFGAHGFAVQAELGHIDLLARRDGVLIAIEVKRNLSLRLVEQAVRRQRSCDLCWVAVPRATRGRLRPDTVAVLKRLGLGLLLVDAGLGVEVALEPQRRPDIVQSRAREALIAESSRRLGRFNIAGSPGGARVTAYRQQALRVAMELQENPGLSPRELDVRIPDIGIRAGPILQRNVYAWFVREQRARYSLSPEGRAALLEWKAVVDFLRAVAEQTPDAAG